MEDSEHTRFAMQAIGLADLFKYMVSAVAITSPVPYRVELSAPDGPSTGGGKQATQHIKLVPQRGGPTIVAGSANPVERAVELRSWNRLAQIHAQRFGGKPLPLDRAQYNHLLAKMNEFFSEQNLPVVVLDSEPMAAGAAQVARAGVSPIWIVIALLGVGAAIYFATR